MALLTVGAVDVSVASADLDYEEVGDRARAFDGTKLSTVRARKRMITIETIPYTTGNATTLQNALNATPPVSCSGDLLGGTVSMHPELKSRKAVGVTGGHRVVLTFVLHEV